MKSKIKVVFSIVLFVLMIAIVVSGYLILSNHKDDGIKNEVKDEYSIIVDDSISVYVGDTYTLVPYLIRQDGTVEESRFQYTPSTNDIDVSEEGVVSVKSIPDTNEEVKITVFERNTSISTDVKVNIIGKLTKVLGITFSDAAGNKMLVSGEQELAIGNTYVIDVVTEPRNVEIKDNCIIKALNSSGDEEEIFDFSYTNTNVAMTVVGLGSGKLQLDITDDDGQSLYTTDFDFSISMEDEELGKEVLLSSNSTLLSKDELAQIETIKLSQKVSDLESLKYLPSLKTVVLLSEEVMEVANISRNYFYRIKTNLFDKYIISETWSEYLECLIPYEETVEELYVVYHNDKTSLGTLEITYDRLENLDNFPTFIYEGYKNFGWLDENGETVSVAQIKSLVKLNGIHLYAGWEPITYKIVYHVRDFEITNEETWHYDQEDLLKTPDDFGEAISRTGYKFAGWTRQSTSSVTSHNIQYRKDVPVSNLTSEEGGIIDLYDIWEPIEYTLIFTRLDGMEELEDLSVKYDTAYTLPTPSRPGYEFIYWKLSNGETLNAGINDPNNNPKLNLSSIDGEEIILTPEFNEITYTIIFELNGGHAEHDVSIVEGYKKSLRYTESYTLPYLTREGYTVYSWYCDSNHKTYGSVDRIVGEFTTACEVTFSAIWTSAVYTINYDCNGGYINGESYVTSNRYWDDNASLLVPTKTGYTFAGWQDVEHNIKYVQGSPEWTSNLIKSEAENGAQFNFKAIWEVNYYDLKISTGEGTTLTVKVNNETKSDGTYRVAFNSTITVSYSANTGYSNATCTFTGGTMPAEDKEIITSATINRHKITKDATKATITVKDASGNTLSSLNDIAYGTAIKVSISYSDADNRSCYCRYNGSNYFVNQTEYQFNMPDYDVTLYAYSNGCFASGTMILMADGTQKPIEEIQSGDLIMSWNFITGQLEVMPVSLYWDHGEDFYNVINMEFSNGALIKVITMHGFFDYDLNEFVYINENNYTEYLHHKFVCYASNGSYDVATLDNVYITYEKTGCYSLRSACNDNAFAGGFLTLTIEDAKGFLTYFEVGEDLKYDEEKMQADIDKYGLFTYEEWAEYVSYEEFVALNGKYFKILLGKGILTMEDIFTLIAGMR